MMDHSAVDREFERIPSPLTFTFLQRIKCQHSTNLIKYSLDRDYFHWKEQLVFCCFYSKNNKGMFVNDSFFLSSFCIEHFLVLSFLCTKKHTHKSNEIYSFIRFVFLLLLLLSHSKTFHS